MLSALRVPRRYSAPVAVEVDSYRFLNFATRQVVRAWIQREPKVAPDEIPWAPMTRSLDRATVSLVSSAGMALVGDRPFDQEGERRNPWWGDPSIRVIPRDAAPEELRVFHLHLDRRPAEQDSDCVLPLRRLRELERAGEIGASAPSHYSYMGYQLTPEPLLSNCDEMVAGMHREQVDVALLAPY